MNLCTTSLIDDGRLILTKTERKCISYVSFKRERKIPLAKENINFLNDENIKYSNVRLSIRSYETRFLNRSMLEVTEQGKIEIPNILIGNYWFVEFYFVRLMDVPKISLDYLRSRKRYFNSYYFLSKIEYFNSKKLLKFLEYSCKNLNDIQIETCNFSYQEFNQLTNLLKKCTCLENFSLLITKNESSKYFNKIYYALKSSFRTLKNIESSLLPSKRVFFNDDNLPSFMELLKNCSKLVSYSIDSCPLCFNLKCVQNYSSPKLCNQIFKLCSSHTNDIALIHPIGLTHSLLLLNRIMREFSCNHKQIDISHQSLLKENHFFKIVKILTKYFLVERIVHSFRFVSPFSPNNFYYKYTRFYLEPLQAPISPTIYEDDLKKNYRKTETENYGDIFVEYQLTIFQTNSYKI